MYCFLGCILKTVSLFFMLLCLPICSVNADECLDWNDPTESVCPDDYRPVRPRGKNILTIGRMIKQSGVERKGNCWNFVKAVYDCSGYATKQVFPLHAKPAKDGPYLKNISMLKPGDWIMHINKEYRQSERIEHSAIFVRWIDTKKKKAYMLDYVGNNQCAEPGYKVHTLSEVYCVMRAIPGKAMNSTPASSSE